MTLACAQTTKPRSKEAESAPVQRRAECCSEESVDTAGLPLFLGGVQTQLTVGAKDDPLEREADEFSRAVMHGEPGAPRFLSLGRTPPPTQVQRLCPECAEELASEAADSAASGLIQRREDSGGTGNRATEATGDEGAPLVPPVRERLEASLGLDLADVRVHSGATSHALARGFNARAFTHGRDIWLGPRQSPDDVGLLAHEVAHVVQQTSGQASPERVQRAPADYRHPEDGGGVAARMQARIDEATDGGDEGGDTEGGDAGDSAAREHEARSASAEIDRGELASEREEIEPSARPDVDRPAAEQPKVEQAESDTRAEADSPAEPLAEAEGEAPPEAGEGEGKEAVSAAEGAASLADAAFGEAAAQPMPGPEAMVLPPAPVSPVDAGGLPLPGDPGADARIAMLAEQAQNLRTEGTRVRAFAGEERANAGVLRGNLELVRQGIGQAEQGVATSNEHLAFRQELAGTAREGLAVSEEKAATVAAEAPNYSAKADEGKAESGPMASEAGQLAAENAANTPDDPEAAADAREQGGKMNQAGSDIATTDDAVTQTRAKAESLGEQAAQAQETNAATSGKLDAMDERLAATGERLGQMTAQNAQARSEVDGLSSAPEAQTRQANAIDDRGSSLVSASFDMEARLHAVQQEYAQAMAAVPAEEEPEAEAGGEELSAPPPVTGEGVVQLSPEEGSGAAAAVAAEAAPEVAPEPVSDEAAGDLETDAAASPLAAGTTAAAPPAEEVGAEGELEEPLVAVGGEPTAAAAAEAPPPERERIDAAGAVAEALPEWMTGVRSPNEEERAEAAAAAEERRQAQIAEIELAAGGNFERLSATDKMGIALRMTGRNLFGSVSNIRWPGWGHLALGLIDPRGPLMGVVSGLGMMLSGAANLFSAEQWARDPLGNLLKSAADIATGLTIILGSITALAGVIIAIMTAITILSFGTAAPVTGPVIAFCTTVLTTVGGWTIAVGKVALVLQALVLIKNLIDAACADTAAELQSEADQMTENVGDAANVLMQMGMAKASQVGGRAAASEIRAAGGGVRYASQLGARAGVGARAGLSAAGRGLRAAPGAIARGARALPGAVARGARALPGLAARGARGVGRGIAAVPGLAVRGARAAGAGLRSLGARGVAAARALPGRALAGVRALPGRIAAAPGNILRGVRSLPGRLRESFGGGLSREFLLGEDIANFGMARSASAEARAAVLAEARAPGGALAGEARAAGAADEAADVRAGLADETAEARGAGAADETLERPAAGRGETPERPPESPPAREASVRESGHVANEDLSPQQLRNEVDDLTARPERLEGTAPNRGRRMGEHEWRERPDGTGFCRLSPTRVCVDTPELRAGRLERAEARLTEAESEAAERTARAGAARERATARGEMPGEDRALMQAEAEAADARAVAARGRAASERRAATRLENSGRADEAAAARGRADAAMREFEEATGDAAAARELLDEPARLARAAEEAEAAAARATREAEEAAGSLARQRHLSNRLDEIAAEERAIMARNRHIEPPAASADGRRLAALRSEAERTRGRLAGEIEAASGLTPDVREGLRRGTPFRGDGGAARERTFLEGLPPEQRGPNGTYIDYVTGEALPPGSLSPDHVVSVDEIFGMEGFGRLPRADQMAILDMPENLRMLSRSLNESKGGRSLSAWLGSEAALAPSVAPAQREALAALEAEAREAVRAEIARRLARMRAE